MNKEYDKSCLNLYKINNFSIFYKYIIKNFNVNYRFKFTNILVCSFNSIISLIDQIIK